MRTVFRKPWKSALEIAERILNRAQALGIPKRDVYIDCLTLTVSAEQENAAATLAAIRQVKEKLGLKTVLGVSNISFGLPNRALINHNFLQMALTCGLDLPILNPGAPDMMRAIAVYKLIMNIDKGAASYIANYSGELLTAASKDVKVAKEKVSAVTKGRGAKDKESTENAECGGLCEEISEIEFAVTNGLSGKCRELIEKQLKTLPPENVINEILIPILDRAGRDFEEGVTFLPQLDALRFYGTGSI